MSDQICPFYEEKVWGNVWHLMISSQVAISHLNIRKGGFCSIHYHRDRSNHFILLSGAAKVLLFGKDEVPTHQPVCSVHLHPNQQFVVVAGTWHQFDVTESGSMVEIYTPSRPGAIVQFEDIVRYSLGGRHNG